MDEILFTAALVLVPLLFGLVPGFLPMRTPALVRWGLWLAVLALAIWYGLAMKDAAGAVWLVVWSTIAASAILSLLVLVAETGRPRAPLRISGDAGRRGR